jgi:hypothetical protein
MSPYDIAILSDISFYFLRLLLAADPTIDPNRRHDLNFAARRQGLFLAFRALSSNVEPTIWPRLTSACNFIFVNGQLVVKYFECPYMRKDFKLYGFICSSHKEKKNLNIL